MTKPRRRTHKINRKRGPKRGFKSRSQRGGEGFWDSLTNLNPFKQSDDKNADLYSEVKPMNKQQTSFQPPSQPSFQQPSQTSFQQPSQTSFQQPEMQEQKGLSVYAGGRRKRTKCKRHHKHSRRCK